MLIVGLTGGIASGKTTATTFFSSRNVPVIDADLIVHALLKSGTKSNAEIINAFGADIVQHDDELDREKLRQLIFSDTQKRQQLEAILHPEVRREIKSLISQITANNTTASYCIVCIPLLVETQQQDLVHRILVIDTPEEIQIQRLRQRDNFADTEIKNILSSQATRNERRAAADDVIINNLDIEHFNRQLNKIHESYLTLAETLAENSK